MHILVRKILHGKPLRHELTRTSEIEDAADVPKFTMLKPTPETASDSSENFLIAAIPHLPDAK